MFATQTEPHLTGSILVFHLDWASGTMTVREGSPHPRSACAGDSTYPLSPSIRVLKQLLRLRGGGPAEDGAPVRFLIDCEYTRERICFRAHTCDDYASVVNVPQERLRAALRGRLTPRETDVAVRLFQGGTIRWIASCLHIAEGTVKRTIYNIYQKMRVNSQVELIREIYALLGQQAAGVESAAHAENAEE